LEREYPQHPMVGVGAIVIEGGRVLLIERGAEPAKGRWSVPGGLVDPGESLKAAVAREVREECGLEVEVGPLVGVLERIIRDEEGTVRYHFVILDFLCRRVAGELCPGSDCTRARWVPWEEVRTLPLTARLEEVLERARNMTFVPSGEDELHLAP